MNQSDDQNKEPRRYFIPVDGKYYETTKEIYEVYYRMDRRERYLEERDLKKGVVNFSDMGYSYYSAEEILSDKDTDIETEIMNKMLMETVLEAISTLDEEEKWLIQELFFCGKSQRQLSKETDIPLMTINNRKKKVLDKLRKQLKI
ncbi:sigma-70 family RNA polymerase sigma factor [Sporosalibacterium faouarense]|uniref:sigma-70 family RNA polymerase sigma factor n=1 Tax=Sporosalibacterium faouarense TaxID=516123 RepID=UPI00192C696A|nr:sigma-70 family RNA polymerase sigma factor [Sporosalibacterium faouarense]